MKEIYILLSITKTIPSILIGTIMRGGYTHSSISLTPRTDHFYSFARRTLNNPLNAGFIIEDVHTFVYSKYENCACAVYSLEISDEAYEKAERIIEKFVENKKVLNYNFLGLLPAKLGIKYERKRNFTCSQFVASVLHYSGAVKLPKHPSLMMPNDFPQLDGVKLIYKGKIKDCSIKEKSLDEISEQLQKNFKKPLIL